MFRDDESGDDDDDVDHDSGGADNDVVTIQVSTVETMVSEIRIDVVLAVSGSFCGLTACRVFCSDGIW